MHILLLFTSFLMGIIIGSKNLSALKMLEPKKDSVYYIFTTIFFITPALGFSYLFLNQPSSIVGGIFFGLALGSLIAIPACGAQLYYKKK